MITNIMEINIWIGKDNSHHIHQIGNKLIKSQITHTRIIIIDD